MPDAKACVVLPCAQFDAGRLRRIELSDSDYPTPTDTAPAITQQPSSVTITAGQTASFSVVATGSATLSYQWQKGTTAIAGATSCGYLIQ